MHSLAKDYQELLTLIKKYIEQEFSLQIDQKSPRAPTHNEAAIINAAAIPLPAIKEKKETSNPVSNDLKISSSSPCKELSPVAKTTPSTIQKKTPENRSPFAFTLEPHVGSCKNTWDKFSVLIQKEFPNLPLIKEIPNDLQAKKFRSSWTLSQNPSDIILLSFQEPPKQTELLVQIANALTVLIKPAMTLSAIKIESEKSWEKLLSNPKLKLIIASDYALYSLPELMKFYREVPKTAEQFLGSVPLFLLADLSLYLREPLLKSSLWKALQKHLMTSN